MFTLPNLLSLSRIPLAFAFLYPNPTLRLSAIGLALITDGLDGFFARKWRLTSKLGTLLDPLTDRFFVLFAIAILIHEHQLETWKIAALFSRDAAILIYGLTLTTTGRLSKEKLRAIWCGKVATVSQLLLIGALCAGFTVPNLFFYPFFILGFLALFELYIYEKERKSSLQD